MTVAECTCEVLARCRWAEHIIRRWHCDIVTLPGARLPIIQINISLGEAVQRPQGPPGLGCDLLCQVNVSFGCRFCQNWWTLGFRIRETRPDLPGSQNPKFEVEIRFMHIIHLFRQVSTTLRLKQIIFRLFWFKTDLCFGWRLMNKSDIKFLLIGFPYQIIISKYMISCPCLWTSTASVLVSCSYRDLLSFLELH